MNDAFCENGGKLFCDIAADFSPNSLVAMPVYNDTSHFHSLKGDVDGLLAHSRLAQFNITATTQRI